MEIPDNFRAAVAGRASDTPGDLDGDAWLARLPSLVLDHLELWGLIPDGSPRHGENALVLPVLRDGVPAALKVGWPHPEARFEHLALRLWNGRGAVRLLAADPSGGALLLERLDADRPLTGLSILEACEVIGELFGQLDRPAPPQVDVVADKAVGWQESLISGTELVPRRLTDQALATLGHMLAEPAPSRLVHEDLHDMNVLAPLDPGRGDWLAIDPKPVAGEWAYAVAPIVWNRADVAAKAHNFRTHVRMRAEIVSDVAGLDEDRVRHWTFVRLVLNALWAAGFAPASDAFRARMIALANAFAD